MNCNHHYSLKNNIESEHYITFADIKLDWLSCMISCRDTSLQLSKKEGQLLEYLMRNPFQTLTRDQLLLRVWGETSEVEEESQTNDVLRIFQNEITISDTYLKHLQNDYQFILSIKDNGNVLFFEETIPASHYRSSLFQLLIDKAKDDGISPYTRPVSSTIVQTPVYTIHGQHNDSYFCMLSNISFNRGYRTILLMQKIPSAIALLYPQFILYIFSYFICLAALFLLLKTLIRKLLGPVEENQKRQQNFIAAASHELHSPLSVIRTQNSLTVTSPKDLQHSRDIIESECIRSARLIDDLLLLAHSKSNSWSMQSEAVNMEMLLIEVYDSMRLEAAKNKITLELSLPDDPLPVLLGDQERIQQVITILINNAISYSKTSPTICLKTSITKKFLIIEVIDHGIGIPEEEKEYVFDRFYRSDKARKDKNHFGLGLSIAKEIMILMHGNIKLTDTPGGGCTFCLHFQINQ